MTLIGWADDLKISSLNCLLISSDNLDVGFTVANLSLFILDEFGSLVRLLIVVLVATIIFICWLSDSDGNSSGGVGLASGIIGNAVQTIKPEKHSIYLYYNIIISTNKFKT